MSSCARLQVHPVTDSHLKCELTCTLIILWATFLQKRQAVVLWGSSSMLLYTTSTHHWML